MIKRWFAAHLFEQEKRFRRVNAPGLIADFLATFSELPQKMLDGQEAA